MMYEARFEDLLCLRFASTEEEAHWIAQKAKSFVGLPFKDKPDAEPRGLAPSDMAVLVRSVKNSGDVIVRALQAVGLLVIVVGMTNLFKTSEARAAVALFAHLKW